MLIDQHPNGNSGHEESVQEVLNVVLGLGVDVVRFFQFQNTLRHRLHDVLVSVPDLYQRLAEPTGTKGVRFS